ncbi:short-subunit dehydrogenase [Okibacterium sp. HSC-33S16]|uniref:SDR family NAD(P)-dependent oxidoreductase n=1 Tax=Okibacterium sp. HSC-33S16 TaxID=2910965 RepID=UPI0020A1B2FD|nr:SDR family NAD(P)-dependent oxidoreductase [Okibacterium sp. HSC-33S16]MCP2031144.1 short-subunit dehydrogenase [Okibacterium sp. HSC-33S16]
MGRHENFVGKTIVITGASSGFGRGVALRLAELGADVVLAARRVEVLSEVAQLITESGGRVVATAVDISDPNAISTLATTAVERFGRIDVWINNAGVAALGMFWDIPIEDHKRLIDVNLTGLVYGAHVALRHFRSQGAGILINVASIDSKVPLTNQASYAASKAAVLSLGRSLNEELRLSGEHRRIRVSTIMPWAVDTPCWTHAANYTGHAVGIDAMSDPADVVNAIVSACVNPKAEVSVGAKPRAAGMVHHLFPSLARYFSAKVVNVEFSTGSRVPPTAGTLHIPMAEGVTVDGGIRARRKRDKRQHRT